MNNKFTMNLVWHNAKTCPPKEEYNDFLIMTDGIEICPVYWDKKEGFLFGCCPITDDYEKLWWADIQQTVQGDSRFEGMR